MSKMDAPCDWQMTKKKVKHRGQYLLETGQWSDCHFIVGTEQHQQVLEGHKLFLAMSSPVFEAMFYGGMAEKDPITIQDVQPDAFKALLEYIYTDKINLASFEQACELCYAAKKYMLPHLVEECTKYIWSDLIPRNACRAYEFAKLFEENKLMEKCLQIISTQTMEVLSEASFDDVELETVITVFEQENLDIETELDLFNTLTRYASKQNINTGVKVPKLDGIASPSSENTHMHPTVRDALKKIRFLTLSPQQFAEGPASSNLLSQSEKFAILMNISSPSIDIPMPEGFSTSTVCRKRQKKNSNAGDNMSIDGNRNYGPLSRNVTTPNWQGIFNSDRPVVNENRKMYCVRELLHQTNIFNQSVLDCSVTVTVDKNICIHGIQVPTQISGEIGDPANITNLSSYTELLYAHLLDADGSRLTYTHFTSRVSYSSVVDISFNRPIYIQRNKLYRIGVVLNKTGHYPIGTYPLRTSCQSVMFTFGQCAEPAKDLVRSIIFTVP